jgi:hypothetical protein
VPPLPAVPKVIRLDFVHTYGGDTDVLSRNFWSYSGTAPTNSEMVTFVTAAGAAWDSNAASSCNADVTLTNVEGTDLSSDTAAQGQSGVSYDGTRAGDTLTADSCFLGAYEIARRYRGGHPRGYWPFGVQVDLASPQEWGSAHVTTFTDALTGMFAAIAAAGWSGAGTIAQVNVSYHSGFTVVTSPTTGRARNVPTVRAVPLVDDVVTVLGRARVASQRRRLGRS